MTSSEIPASPIYDSVIDRDTDAEFEYPIGPRTQQECSADPSDSLESSEACNSPQDDRILGLIELILKSPERLERMIRQPALQAELIPRFLAISLISFSCFGIAASIVLDSAGVWPQLANLAEKLQGATPAPLLQFQAKSAQAGLLSCWLDGSALTLIFVYNLGLIAATGVCLPSLYFYGLLAGVRMSMLDVVVHSLKAKATAAVCLVGILPIYVAVSMGIIIFEGSPEMQTAALWLGLALPFLGGLAGTRSLYFGFAGLVDTLPCERRARRECFLRRLVLSWSAVYTAVSPVMIFTLWEYFARG